MDTVQMNDWLHRWQTGDRQAIEELLRATYPQLENLAHKMLHHFPQVRRFNDTNDVLQNAVLRLLRSLRQLDPPPASTREFFGLAATEFRRELLDLARGLAAAKRKGELQLDEAHSPAINAADQRDPVEELERWAAFHEAVGRLAAEEREVVGLIFYHGWTQVQVAELFGVTERTIGRRWRSACVHLEQELGGQLPGEAG